MWDDKSQGAVDAEILTVQSECISFWLILDEQIQLTIQQDHCDHCIGMFKIIAGTIFAVRSKAPLSPDCPNLVIRTTDLF